MPNEAPTVLELILVIFTSVFASSGFWVFLQKKNEKKDSKTKLLLGLAHDRIVWVGKSYIVRGYITIDEYEDFLNYLWLPYSAFGGNGLAERIKLEVDALPVTYKNIHTQFAKNEKRET